MGTSWVFISLVVLGVKSLQLPGDCKQGDYYDPGTLNCISCPINSSMVTSSDGLFCACDGHSARISPRSCRACAANELLSADGASCVPRKCQASGGRVACRKCPNGYISVTQNLDGSVMKEVQCVKCASGYKPQGASCVRCEACACAKQEAPVRGTCVQKRFLASRPKYKEGKLHNSRIQDIIKYEYLCTLNDVRACRTLANECVKSFYSSDLGGPCRLWLQTDKNKNLPPLNIAIAPDKSDDEIKVSKSTSKLQLNLAIHSDDGGFAMVREGSGHVTDCSLPLEVTVGQDVNHDCTLDTSKPSSEMHSTVAPYVLLDGDLKAVPISVKTPGDSYVQRGMWSSTKFRRYFLVHNFLSALTNATTFVYLRTLTITLRVDRSSGSDFAVSVSIEAQYASTSSMKQMPTTSFRVKTEGPSTNDVKGLEIWLSVLSVCLSLFALVQWRGAVRRGGAAAQLLPVLAGGLADALYFGAWLWTLVGVAAEGVSITTTDHTHLLAPLIYSAVALKAVKVIWINWKQCRCDIFFLDWTEYNPPYKAPSRGEAAWRKVFLAREWSRVQTERRAAPSAIAAAALAAAALLQSWESKHPHNNSHKWAIGMLSWWAAYLTILALRWAMDRVSQPFAESIPKVCNALGLSLLVFEEEYYAHYVHGRNDDPLDVRIMSGPLKCCRLVCTPQLRTIFKQLLTPVPGVPSETESRHALLSKFLAAFFEKSLEGLSWVSRPRGWWERAGGAGAAGGAGGAAATLLHGPGDPPSWTDVTWWGAEWSLATLDAALYGCVLLATADHVQAALLTLLVWQVLKILRAVFGDKNQWEKTLIDKNFNR